MLQNTVRSALCLAAGLLFGCQTDGAHMAQRDGGVDTAPSGSLSPETLGEHATGDTPPADYKALRKWRAMRALTFGEGGVAVDAGAAAELGLPESRAQALTRFRRGMSSLEGNEVWNAISDIRDAIVMHPDEAIFYDGLGRALLAERQDVNALAAFKTAVALDPGMLDARLHLADAYNRTGDMDASIDAFRSITVDHPDVAEAHARLAVLLYYRGDDAGAWTQVHAVEALGADVPPQFRRLLDARTPETR